MNSNTDALVPTGTYIMAVRSESADKWYVYDDNGDVQTDFSLAATFSTLAQGRNYFRSLVNTAIVAFFHAKGNDAIPPAVLGYMGPPASQPHDFQPTIRWIAKPNSKQRRTEFKELVRKHGLRFGHEHVF
tara:strand:- start:2186 stop:2575 length:390 start_codon:yes stop_codon:yes gene_type:complete